MRRPERCFRVVRGRPRPCIRALWPVDGEGRYALAVDRVLEHGREVADTAAELKVDEHLLGVWVRNRRVILRALDEIDSEGAEA